MRIQLNDDWKFSGTFKPEMTGMLYDEAVMEEVRLPHANVQTPFHYFEEQLYQLVSGYRRHIRAEKDWQGKRVLITFEGAAHVAKVYMNGKPVVTHYGGYTAFTADLAPYLNYGEDNVLAVELDSRETCNVPPFGYVIDYMTYGGIYREVYLDIKEEISIEDVFVMTRDIEASGEERKEQQSKKEVELEVTYYGNVIAAAARVKYYITDTANLTVYHDKKAVAEQTEKLRFIVDGVKNWGIEEPNLYYLHLELLDGRGRAIDTRTVRFGFRTCEFKADGFYLNHKRIKLIGLNRHQSYPYVGYAMPKRLQQLDAQILKEELQVNAVRTSHYPQSQHFIDRCDELGLLVFTEIPGWQHIGDEKWKQHACEHVREMVLQYRNHPAVILWGVRINESLDDDEFYTRTNAIAHELDPLRQTGGVRYLKKSSLLEDVYTYNDFIHNGTNRGIDKKEEVTPHKNVPYLITEFNGHMFPTKAFDSEEHRLQHALRHARVLDAIYEQDEVAGGFGWCMFDYNTHKDFGSGDRICYHGVMDMFRNPKLAAAVYASQGERGDVFEISSSLNIGEHPGGNIGELYAFTNADSVKLYKNDVFIKEFFPDKVRYANLPHPPIRIDDFVGELLEEKEHYRHKTAEVLKEVLFAVQKYGQNNLPLKYKLKMASIMLKEHLTMEEGVRLYYQYIGSWGGAATTFRFEAIRKGRTVKTIERKPSGKPILQAVSKSTVLKEEETYDAAEIRITAVDGCGNRLPYYQEAVTLSTWGSVELIGPEVISLMGGAAGTYVRTRGIEGEGGLQIRQAELGMTEIKFHVLQ